jgi:hypothetical protein
MTMFSPMDWSQLRQPKENEPAAGAGTLTRSGSRLLQLTKCFDLRRGSSRIFAKLGGLFGLQPLEFLHCRLLARFRLRLFQPREPLLHFLDPATGLTQCRLQIFDRVRAKNLRAHFQRSGSEVRNLAFYFRDDCRIDGYSGRLGRRRCRRARGFRLWRPCFRRWDGNALLGAPEMPPPAKSEANHQAQRPDKHRANFPLRALAAPFRTIDWGLRKKSHALKTFALAECSRRHYGNEIEPKEEELQTPPNP